MKPRFLLLSMLLLGALASCNKSSIEQVAVDYLANYHSAHASSVVAVTYTDAAGNPYRLIDPEKVNSLSLALSNGGKRVNHSENFAALKREPFGSLSLDYASGDTLDPPMQVFAYPERDVLEFMLPGGESTGANYRAADAITLFKGYFAPRHES